MGKEELQAVGFIASGFGVYCLVDVHLEAPSWCIGCPPLAGLYLRGCCSLHGSDLKLNNDGGLFLGGGRDVLSVASDHRTTLC